MDRVEVPHLGGDEREQATFRVLFEDSPNPMWVYDTETLRFLDVNEAAIQQYGYSRDEFLRMRITEIRPGEDTDRLLQTVHQEGGGKHRQAQWRHRTKDGRLIDVQITSHLLDFRGHRAALVLAQDITERVRSYELLEQRVAERTRELTTLLDIACNLTSTLELEPLLTLILDGLGSVVEYDGASLLALEGDDLVVLVRRAPGMGEREFPTSYTVASHGAIWDRLRRGEPVLIGDVYAEDPLAQTYRALVGDYLNAALSYEGSFLAVPLMLKDGIMGILSLSSGEKERYTNHHVRLTQAVAQQAAVAIENARLYARAQEIGVLEERQRLARELHDSVTQALFSMTLHSAALQMGLGRAGVSLSGQSAHSMEQLTRLSQAAVAEMRALIFELRPGALREEGLVAALRKHAAALSARQERIVSIEAPADRVALSEEVEEQLFRVAQEALHNVVKHAHAGRVTVRIEEASNGEAVGLEVIDDGRGFDTTLPYPGHMGLRTMLDRVQRVGGTLDVASVPGEGTTVRVTVPRRRV